MDIQGPSDSLRVDYSRVNQYVGSELEKPSFWQSVKKGFAKFGSFLGTATGVVGPLFGPLGMIAAAAGYGVKNVSNRALEKMTNREQFDLANQPTVYSVSLPGFMEEPTDSVGSFVAPSYLEPSIEDVIIQSQGTQQDMMHSI